MRSNTLPVQTLIIDGTPVKMVSLYQCHKMMGIKKDLFVWARGQIQSHSLTEILGGLTDSLVGQLPPEPGADIEGVGVGQPTPTPPESGAESTELTDSSVGQLPPGDYIRRQVQYKVPHLGGVRTVTVDDVFLTIEAAILICVSSKTERGRMACRSYIYTTQAKVEHLERKVIVLENSFKKAIAAVKESEGAQPLLPYFEELQQTALAVKPRLPVKPRLKVTNLPVDPEAADQLRQYVKIKGLVLKTVTSEIVMSWLSVQQEPQP